MHQSALHGGHGQESWGPGRAVSPSHLLYDDRDLNNDLSLAVFSCQRLCFCLCDLRVNLQLHVCRQMPTSILAFASNFDQVCAKRLACGL